MSLMAKTSRKLLVKFQKLGVQWNGFMSFKKIPCKLLLLAEWSSSVTHADSFALRLTGCGSVNFQDWQARPCQMSLCWDWYLQWKEAGRYCSLFPQLWCMSFCSLALIVKLFLFMPFTHCFNLLILHRFPMWTVLTTSWSTFPRMDLYVLSFNCCFLCWHCEVQYLIYLLHFRSAFSLIMEKLRMTSGSQPMTVCLNR